MEVLIVAAPSAAWTAAGVQRVISATVALRAGRACHQEAGVAVPVAEVDSVVVLVAVHVAAAAEAVADSR